MSKINFSLCGGKNMCYISEQGSSLYCEQQVISFRPPKQESYKIKGTQPRNSNESFSCKVDIDFPYFSNINFMKWISFSCYNLTKEKKKSIICLYIRNNSITNNEDANTMIYSHSNSTDLGLIFPMLIDFSVQFKCNVIAYDYSGYGKSTDKPKLENLTYSIDTVIEFSLNELKIPIESIFLFGRDLGAIPSCYISTKNIFSKMKGMILLSPLFGDAISQRTLKEIKIPVFVIHGNKDYSFSHILLAELCKNIKNEVDWFPKAENADIIVVNNRRKFLCKIKKFLAQIKGLHSKSFVLSSSISNESLTTSDVSDSLMNVRNESLNKSSSKEIEDSRGSQNASKFDCTMNMGNGNSKFLEYDDDEEEEGSDNDSN